MKLSIKKVEQFFLLSILYVSPMHKIAWDIGVRIRIEYICAGVLLGLVILQLLAGKSQRLNAGVILVVFLILLAGILSWFRVVNNIQYLKGLISLFISLIVFVFINQHVRDPKTVDLFWKHWLLASLVIAGYGLVQWGGWRLGLDIDRLFFEKIILRPRKLGLDPYTASFHRVTSLALDTNNLSLYFCTVIPLWVHEIVNPRYFKSRLVAMVGGSTVLFVNIMTLSRSGWGGLLISLIFSLPLLGYCLLHSKRLSSRSIRFVFLSLLLGGLIFFCVNSPQDWIRVAKLRLQMTSGTLLHFYELPRVTFDMLAKSPLVGWGINQFPILYSRWYRPDLPPVWNTHNGFLTILVDMGLLGFMAYLLMFGYTVVMALKVFMKVPSKRLMVLFLLWGYLAYLVGNIGYNAFGFSNFWVYQSLLVSSAIIWLKRDTSSVRRAVD